MFCSRCGANVAEGTVFCPQCGLPVATSPGSAAATPPPAAPVLGAVPPAPPPPPVYSAPPVAPPQYPQQYAVPTPRVEYAGFWLRLVAFVIDVALQMVFLGLIILILVTVFGVGAFGTALSHPDEAGDAMAPLFALGIFLGVAVLLLGTWLYYAYMESSNYQGTVGKMALGLYVTDLQGRGITFARASGRFFARIITGLIPFYIGFIMAGFTEKKQAVHDMIASCLVLRKA
jgi:uncharacterized RDD family membrane protein YckC